jgi:hypothetical protein
MSFASPLAVFSTTVAVAPPLSSTIRTPPIAKRFHMPSHSEGGRSRSFIGQEYIPTRSIHAA